MITKNTSLYGKILIFIFLIMMVWWLFINVNSYQNTTNNFLYGAALGFLPIISAIFGFINAKKWGGSHSVMGRSMIFLSLGLFTWGIGTLVFAYYNLFLNIEVPYPSVADAFYIISWPLWVLSMVNLSKATGVRFQLKKMSGRLILFVVPLITMALSYYMLVIVARGGISYLSEGFIKMFFDLAYPIGDVVILTITLLIYGLSFNYLGGRFKRPILLIIIGFVINYLADFFFSYTTTKGTYFVADWVDFMFTVAVFLLGLGVSLLAPVLEKIKNS